MTIHRDKWLKGRMYIARTMTQKGKDPPTWESPNKTSFFKKSRKK
jgi:hypothetical protein